MTITWSRHIDSNQHVIYSCIQAGRSLTVDFTETRQLFLWAREAERLQHDPEPMPPSRRRWHVLGDPFLALYWWCEEMVSMILSHHGRQRLTDRARAKPHDRHRKAQAAWELGVGREETHGPLRQWLDWRWFRFPGSIFRVFNGRVYVWKGQVLITVLRVPVYLRAAAKRSERRKKA